MKNNPLERYDRLEDGSYIISTRVKDRGDLFSEFDFASALWKRDLKQEYVDFLYDSVEEIGRKNKFVVQIILSGERAFDDFPDKMSQALTDNFLTLIHYTGKAIGKLLNKILFNIILSVSTLALVYFIGRYWENTDSMLYMIFVEGLYVAAWVLLWPVFSDFLFDIKEELGKASIYKRLLKSPIIVKKDR